jgi:hypothetical protein
LNLLNRLFLFNLYLSSALLAFLTAIPLLKVNILKAFLRATQFCSYKVALNPPICSILVDLNFVSRSAIVEHVVDPFVYIWFVELFLTNGAIPLSSLSVPSHCRLQAET